MRDTMGGGRDSNVTKGHQGAKCNVTFFFQFLQHYFFI